MAVDRDTTIIWYGHACTEIRSPGGKTILVDPWFSNPKSSKPADAVEIGDMQIIRELYEPELAILPIGGHFTMGPREAAMAVEWLRVKHVMPIHYGTFPILAWTPDALRQALSERGVTGVEVLAPEPGEAIS